MRARPGIAILLALAAAAPAACSHEKGGPPRPPVPVVLAEATRRTVPYEVSSFGNVEAYRTVSVQAQVEGVLDRVAFAQGQPVRRGDLLLRIDPAPYRATLHAALARLARDSITARNLAASLDRYASLASKSYISAQQHSDMQAQLAETRASVRADSAQVEQARLDLGHCTITAPIDGLIGARLVDEGNVVKAEGAPLAVINQVRPVYVTFAVPESHLPEIRAGQAAAPLEVRAAPPGEPPDAHTGRLVFVDNRVDRATGTILLKAELPNEDRALWPGQFVNVVLVLKRLEDVVVVPSRAVETGQQGEYVFVVQPDSTAEIRRITTTYRFGEDAVVGEGIAAGERVVVDGQLRLRPGARVADKPPVRADGTQAP